MAYLDSFFFPRALALTGALHGLTAAACIPEDKGGGTSGAPQCTDGEETPTDDGCDPDPGTTSDPTTGAPTTDATTGEPPADTTTGGEAGPCAAVQDEASCNALNFEDTACRWLAVKTLAVDGCEFGAGEGRCVEVSINDGGCSPCIYKDLGAGQFEVAEQAGDAPGCQSDLEFESCYLFEPGQDPPVCDCLCPNWTPL